MIKVVFFGTPKIALKSLDYLVKSSNIEVIAVVTQPDKPAGRGHKLVFSPIKQYAVDNNVLVFQPMSIRKDFEVQQELKKINPDFFVTFAFGQILSKEVLDIPKYSTINLHASLLPKYRGANPVQRAIIEGDKKTGICTMITEEGLDCGEICLRDEIEIPENMNFVELFELISEKSPELIEETLLQLKSGKMIPQEQCHSDATHAKKMTKEESKIDWGKSARQIHNLVRGIYKFPSAHCFFRDKFIKIKQTKILSEGVKQPFQPGEIIAVNKEGVEVATVDGVLLIVKIKPEGKAEMFAKDWANGLKDLKGDRFL